MNERAKYKLIGFIMMFCSSSLMGGIGAFTRFIDAPGDFVSFWRNFAGLIALTIIFLFIGGFKKVKATRFSGMMLLSGIFLGLLSGLYCLSTQYTTLANASFLIYTGPIYSTILAAIFLKEKIDWRGIICIIAVVVGMLFIVGIVTPEGLTLDLDPTYTFGNAIAFASGVAYGLYLFFSRYREDCDSNVRSWWNFLFASLAILVLLLWHNFCLQPLSYTEKVNGVTQVDAAGQIITHPWNLFTMPLDSWLWLIAAAHHRLRRVLSAHPCHQAPEGRRAGCHLLSRDHHGVASGPVPVRRDPDRLPAYWRRAHRYRRREPDRLHHQCGEQRSRRCRC